MQILNSVLIPIAGLYCPHFVPICSSLINSNIVLKHYSHQIEHACLLYTHNFLPTIWSTNFAYFYLQILIKYLVHLGTQYVCHVYLINEINESEILSMRFVTAIHCQRESRTKLKQWLSKLVKYVCMVGSFEQIISRSWRLYVCITETEPI